MAEFNKLIITNKGQELIAKLIANQSNIEFTKISTSNNVYAEEEIVEMINMENIKQTANVAKTTRINSTEVQLEAALDNLTLNTGYNLNSVGVYAKDKNDNEILYAVASVKSSSKGSYMPAYNNLTVTGAYLKLTMLVSNAENVVLNVNQAGVATIANINELQNQISDLQAFIGYTDNNIYGVEVDFAFNKFKRLAGAVGKTAGRDFDFIHCFRRKRCNVTDDGKVVAYYGDEAFTTTGALTQEVEVDSVTYPVGTKVQVMVRQPKFYYKVVPVGLIKDELGTHIGKANYYVSNTLKAGFKVHPAFIKNGKEVDYIYKSAFEGSLYNATTNQYMLEDEQILNSSNTLHKLSSIANALPACGDEQALTRERMRKSSNNRGNGLELEYIATFAATQMLTLIEYATFNLQEAIGDGNVNFARQF